MDDLSTFSAVPAHLFRCRKHLCLGPEKRRFLSRPKNLHKIHTVVKITERKKVGIWSKGVPSFYVNQKLDIHNPRPMWKTPVDKLVDNVENSELSTGIPVF